MRVRTTQEELSREDIASLLFRHENEFMGRVMRLKRYYAGGHDILHKAARANNAPNNMIVANYCEYITSMNTGFFMGQPVTYSSRTEDEKGVEALLEVFKYNDEAAHNILLAEEASIAG
ncbi:MAG: phage portal protein, partial [Selenomonadaceae bacterium]|nr:phage portal protein [Selenomonadaceae bacterium]